MFGVFNKGQFKGLWHNQKDDKGWLDRTIRALGWIPQETEAYWYQYNFDSQTVYIFDENKNLLIQGEKMLEINGEQIQGWGTILEVQGERFVP